jgi:hypothetical protein
VTQYLVDRHQEGGGNSSPSDDAMRELEPALAAEVWAQHPRLRLPYGRVPRWHALSPADKMPEVSPLLERPEAMGQAAIYLCSDEAKELSGQHFYSRHLLRDRVNNGQDLYQGDASLFAKT